METVINREKLLKAIRKAQVDNTNTALSFGLMEAHHIILTQEALPFDEIEKLTKTHEAEPMTMEDIERIYNINAVGIWPFNTPPYLWISKRPPVSNPENWICWSDICCILKNRDERLNRENYGISWMLWTKRPTDEQRRAVKWITPQRDIDELLEEIRGCVPGVLFEELKKAVKGHPEESDDNTRED